MKAIKYNDPRPLLKACFVNCLGLILALLVFSCSPNEEVTIGEVATLTEADMRHALTAEQQLEFLTIHMRKFYNHNVAIAQGWDTDGTGYIPNMGHHFINGTLVDGTFDLLKPEALLYVPDDDGKMQFVGVEYLVLMEAMEDPSTPPDGFIGDDDEWTIVGPFWTLHAWVGLENPDGVFAPFNPLVD